MEQNHSVKIILGSIGASLLVLLVMLAVLSPLNKLLAVEVVQKPETGLEQIILPEK